MRAVIIQGDDISASCRQYGQFYFGNKLVFLFLTQQFRKKVSPMNNTLFPQFTKNVLLLHRYFNSVNVTEVILAKNKYVYGLTIQLQIIMFVR